MIIREVQRLIESGNFRTMPDIQEKLDITSDELKGILEILVSIGKLKKTESNVQGGSACSTCLMCKSGKGCAGCTSRCDTHTHEDDDISKKCIFYQPTGNYR